jgi:hypothetical protein
MMYSVWLYRFKPGMTATTLDKLRARGAGQVYPGCEPEGSTFLGRVWGDPTYTYGSVYRRDGVAAAQAEATDVGNLVKTLRILSPAVAAMEIRNIIPCNDAELRDLGDDEWHRQVVAPWVAAARANPEVAHHLDVIGISCIENNIFPPYPVQAWWRDRFHYPQQWLGGVDPRTYVSTATTTHSTKTN